MDLTPEYKVDTLGHDDRWIGSSHGIDNGETGTLTTATVAEFRDALGILPSGIGLGLITATDTYGLFDPAANDGREVLAGFLLSVEPVTNSVGGILPKIGISVLRHGGIRRKFLPVAAQRTGISAATPTTGLFTFRD